MAATSSASLFGLADTQMPPPPPQNPNNPPAPAPAPPKKKRNQPGNPNPDAEVIALSPRTLMATNRFVCEVCNKGFQREQNLQLHRRGHNLPWKLKQKNPKESRRRVYLCPEVSCVHHDPSRALGDLTGIKKHYCRKHGEKKWRCDKCSKRYAVQSDWKAHSKTCGTREYRCDCGTLFSRRDSFITHRAFCDALAQENARMPPIDTGVYGGVGNMSLSLTDATMAAPQLTGAGIFPDQHQASSAQPMASSGNVLRLGGSSNSSVGGGASQFDQIMASSSPGASMFRSQGSSSSSYYLTNAAHSEFPEVDGQITPAVSHGGGSLLHGKPASFHDQLMQFPTVQHHHHQQNSNGNNNNLLNLSFLSGNNTNNAAAGAAGNGTIVTTGGGLAGGFQSMYNSSESGGGGLPQMSATALLQKAAQMGATTSSYSAGAASERQYQNIIMGSMASGGACFADGFSLDTGKLSTRDFLAGVSGAGSSAMAPPRHGVAGLHVGSLDPANMN
uniref:Protein EARLY HEADING DATE 2 n=1 Tax=Leersia perrieri TaxID=77586 RepID=A0A0D9XGK9_9ORYZ